MLRSPRSSFLVLVVSSFAVGLSLGTARPSFAQTEPGAPPAGPKPEAARAEARSRFERGLRSFDTGDLPGALAEFNRAQALLPNPNVLYNIAQVYAAMGKPVEATRIAKQILAEPTGLGAASLAGAKKILAEQQTKVAMVELSVNVPGAHVEVDNVDVAQTPLKAPLEVSTGTHVIGVFATGHVPMRKEISVAGETSTKLSLELVPMEGKVAHLKLTATLLDAQLIANGEPIGTTPFPASLTLAPGKYKLELRRPGYTSQPVEVTLGDGATGDVTLPWQEDTAASTPRGLLSLRISEPNSVLSIDGIRKGTYDRPLTLPAGKHRVRVEHDGFLAAERDVIVKGDGEREISLYLAPTNETRRAYFDRATSRRRWSYVTIGAGAAITAGSAVFLVVNGSKLSDANATYDAVVADSKSGGGGSCDPTGQRNAGVCIGRFDDATATRDTYKTRQVIGYVGGAVGIATLGTGIVLALTNDDPHKYDREPATAKAAWPVPVAYGLPGGGFVGLAGGF